MVLGVNQIVSLLSHSWHFLFCLLSSKKFFFSAGQHVTMKSGLLCLLGMLVFIVVEKLFAVEENDDKDDVKEDGKIKEIEIEEIEKLLEVERKQRGVSKGEGICGNGTVTAKQLYDSCVFNNNSKGRYLKFLY